jgi:hypothetical protein
MAWALNQSSTLSQQSGTTTASTSFGTLPAAGDRIFVFATAFNNGGGAVTPTFSDNQGNSYTTHALSYDGDSTGHGVWIGASNALIAAPGGTFTCTISGFNASSSIGIFAASFSGGAANSADATATNQNTSGSVTIDTLAAGNATSHANVLIVQASNTNGGTTSITEAVTNTDPSSGWANLVKELSSGASNIDVNYVVASAITTPRYVQTVNPSIAWFTALAAFTPPGGAVTMWWKG